MRYEIIFLSIIVSVIFAELTGFSPVGLIVPGYFVGYLYDPKRIIYTLVIAFISFLIVKQLGKVMILYGRRIFAVTVLVAFFLGTAISYLKILPSSYQVIGSLIAGITAREFDKQGVWQSLLSLGIVMGIISLLLFLVDGGII